MVTEDALLPALEKEVLLMYADACRLSPAPLKRGDRVRIKDGYDRAGEVYFYDAKSAYEIDTVSVVDGEGNMRCFLAEAIEPYPYTREERIERAIEDFAMAAPMSWLLDGDDLARQVRAVLFAILDAGV